MGELIDNTGMVVGQLYINATLHGHGQAMIKNYVKKQSNYQTKTISCKEL